MIYDAIIIGGGPAGLMAANVLTAEKVRFLLLEKNDQLGRKLLITGGKRCNVTNRYSVDQFIANLNFKHKKFLYPTLKSFGPEDVITFFKKRNLNLVLEEDLKYFPETNKSSSVLEALVQGIDPHSIKLRSNVKNIRIEDEVFSIKTAEENYLAKHVVISTGSNAYPYTGSSGDGLYFAEKLGISVIPFTPAETHVYSAYVPHVLKDLQGVSVSHSEIKIPGTKVIHHGGLLFTHFGLSGPAILHAAEDIYDAIEHGLKDITISLVDMDRSELTMRMESAKNRNELILKFLESVTNKSLAKKTLEITEIPNKYMKEISAKQYQLLIDTLLTLRIPIDRVETKERAFVNKGGISTTELDPKTMQVKKIKGLYAIGETVDVHGPIGGFNITIAMSAGFAAAHDIADHIKSEKKPS
jgi:predicted Rossmann fold flavoprotein